MDRLSIYNNLNDTDKMHFNSLNNLYKVRMMELLENNYSYKDAYIEILERIVYNFINDIRPYR